MKRKLFLTILITFALLAFGAVCASAATEGYLTYSVSNGKATITDCDTSATGELVIPDTLGGYPVTSIGNSAFRDCSGLTSVTIPDSVESIGSYAFYNCSGLSRVNIADIAAWCNIEFIGSYSNPLYYANNLYLNGSLVTNLVIPDSVESIGNYAFYNCSSLTSVTIGNSVTSIGNYAFSDCSGLTSVTIGNSVESIGSYAFSGCSSLTSVTIGNSVTSIGNYAFYNCSSLTRVNITDIVAWCNIEFIGSYSNPLYYANNLYLNGNLVTNLVIPDSVESIGNYAFYNCRGLTSVTIPDSVESIGNSAFEDCSSLTRVNITDIVAWCNIEFIGSYSNPLYYANNLYLNGSLVTNLVIPDGVTSIGAYAFYNCDGLTSVTIPDSVTSIGAYAFYYCRGLTSVTIPDSVTSIGAYAFYNCDGLTSVTIPDSVTSIGNYAFSSCNGLTSITIGKSVTSIGDYAFRYCDGLTSVTIPDSVTSIGASAFEDCSGLTSVTIPDGVTSIGDAAFYYCSGLTSVTVGSGITLIPEKAFWICSNLKYVCLPAELLYIRNDAFSGCTNIKTVFYAGSETEWNEILFYNRNENLTNAKIVYNAEKKTYSFVTNCDNSLADITDFAIFTMPTVKNDGATIMGWYDNAELSGEPVTFPYYGDATTLYAAWTGRTGTSFDDAFIAKANREYTVTTTESGQLIYFEFVPKLSKTYKFYSTGSKDTYGYLYNSNKSQLVSDDDDGDGNNFLISYNLTAGQTYYIAAKIYSGTGSFTFVVEEPVDYQLNSITLTDKSGNTLESIPRDSFLASVSFTNISSNEDTVIVLGQYSENNEFCGLMYVKTKNVPTGSTIELMLSVDNTSGEVAKLKAFCWESLGSMTPMGNAVSFPQDVQ